MSELKPCPFCGGEAAFDFDDSGYEWIYCRKCGINTDTEISTDCCAKEKLSKAWNNRPHDNKIKAEAVRAAFLDGAACFGVMQSTAIEVYETSDTKIKLDRGDI